MKYLAVVLLGVAAIAAFVATAIWIPDWTSMVGVAAWIVVFLILDLLSEFHTADMKARAAQHAHGCPSCQTEHTPSPTDNAQGDHR